MNLHQMFLEAWTFFCGNYWVDSEGYSYGQPVWLAASSGQHTRSCITFCAEFFGKTSNHTGDSATYSPDLVPCDFWIFPKLKSPLKGKRFQTIGEFQENTMGQLMAIERTVWGSKEPTLKGTEVSLSCVQYFLDFVSSSANVSIFHMAWLDTVWTGLVHPLQFHNKSASTSHSPLLPSFII